ncbi:hypothetical protein [Gimesia sp.]|uniref:hypothetical protein n=1 Tax=Gimesia sp. TaxID=2024833 RepID=UPI000C55D0FF|nr:hypothetical protein [Gimesia sp.]MAX39033.1 hypothetical protein [Gimesia sp.]HAH49324.1 hypothetical protein [Planctomycetaceae bacterium]
MFPVLLKAGLSLVYLSSLIATPGENCVSNRLTTDPHASAVTHCCPTHSASHSQPVSPISSECCQCCVDQFPITSKPRLPAPATGLFTLNDFSLPGITGQISISGSSSPQTSSRPLYLMHCIWIC